MHFDVVPFSYPLFESLHTIDLHETPVTYCDYITDPNTHFYQNLLLLQSKQTSKRVFSRQVRSIPQSDPPTSDTSEQREKENKYRVTMPVDR